MLFAVTLVAMNIVYGQLSVNPVFSDGAVLQQGRPINIWGETRPQERVVLEINDIKTQVCSGRDGRWFAQLSNTLELGNTYQLTIADTNDTLYINDLVSGDVWVASGQSNMQWRIDVTEIDDQILHIDTLLSDSFENLRIFEVEKVEASNPKTLLNEDAPPISGQTLNANQWLKMRTFDTIQSQSAVPYYFGRKLHQIFDYPIGIINASRGSTRISAWMPEELETDTFEIPDESYFNGMIAPLMPIAHKGVIFWQGENNVYISDHYSEKLVATFNAWRNLWGQEFDVYQVLLSNYKGNRFRVRNEQISASLKGDKIHMVTAFDIGGYESIEGSVDYVHPPQKKLIGERLAYSVLTNTYQLPNYHRPIPQPVNIHERNDSTFILLKNDGEPLMELNSEIQDSTFMFSTVDAPYDLIYSAKAKFIADTVIYLYGFPTTTVSNISYNHSGYATFHIKDSHGTPMNPFDTSYDSSYVYLYDYDPVRRDPVDSASCVNLIPVTMEQGTVGGVGSDWMRIEFSETFNAPVIVATPVLASASSPPVITRIQNVDEGGFDLKVQGAGGTAPTDVTVNWLVVEEGTYTIAEHGIKLEARTFISSRTAGKSAGWALEAHDYHQTYTNPVVLGQVMSYNDPGFSVFWSSNSNRTSPATPTSLRAGKQVSGALDYERSDEVIGMIIIENGAGNLNGLTWEAGVGLDIVEGIDNQPSGITYTIDVPGMNAGVLSAAGMVGGDGGWPMFLGSSPLSDSIISLTFDEDQFQDSERQHVAEQVAYFVIGYDPGLIIAQGTVDEVDANWTTISLSRPFANPVIVATPVLNSIVDVPVVTRLRNVTSSSFEVRIQGAGGEDPVGVPVHWVAVEEGTYTAEEDGVRMEARTFISEKTAGKYNNWELEAHTYNQSYTDPVVIGQVMSYNDADFSVFWSSNGNRTSPASSSSLRAGKQVSGDPNVSRNDEVIGMIIIESGAGSWDGVTWQAGVGSDIVEGIENDASGFEYTINVRLANAAVLSVAGMDGGDGGWPVLVGDSPVGDTHVTLAFDEDQVDDVERLHTTEQVAYFVIGQEPDLIIEKGTIEAVNQNWSTVSFSQQFIRPVVIATPVLPEASSAPLVTRVRNVTGSSFEICIQNAGAEVSGDIDVHWVAVEEGTYTYEYHGIKMEAQLVTSISTANKVNWSLEKRTFNQVYNKPVVLGQVMTYNDPQWSVFWSSNSARTSPAAPNSFTAGKHVANDPSTTRANETLGMIILESGSGAIENLKFEARVGADIVEGPDDSVDGFSYSHSLTAADVAVVSSAGMDGGDGGWPVLFDEGVTGSAISVVVDEDVISDSERSHTTEQISYLILADLIPNARAADFTEQMTETQINPLTPGDNAIIVYPNPTEGFFSLGFNGVYEVEELEVALIELSGKTQELKPIGQDVGGIRFNVSDRTSGLYILQVKTGSNTFSHPLILLMD